MRPFNQSEASLKEESRIKVIRLIFNKFEVISNIYKLV